MQRRFLILTTLAMMLTACGFHLRGSHAIPPELNRLHLQLSDTSPLSRPLRDAMKTAGITLDGSGYTLAITRDRLSKQTTNTDSRAKVAEYALTYDVGYRITGPDGVAPGPERRLTLRRSYQYDTTAIVGKSEEEETLVRELYADAAQQILRQLSFYKASPAP